MGFEDWGRWNTYQVGRREENACRILQQFLFSAPVAWLEQGLLWGDSCPRCHAVTVVHRCIWTTICTTGSMFLPYAVAWARQCGALSWPCGLGQGDILCCPRPAAWGVAVSLLCMALRACWQFSRANINQTVGGGAAGHEQNISNLEVNREDSWQHDG